MEDPEHSVEDPEWRIQVEDPEHSGYCNNYQDSPVGAW